MMSEAAEEWMRKIAEAFAAKHFHAGFNWSHENDDVHQELYGLRLIKPMGTIGAPWALTESGRQWCIANRPDV